MKIDLKEQLSLEVLQEFNVLLSQNAHLRKSKDALNFLFLFSQCFLAWIQEAELHITAVLVWYAYIKVDREIYPHLVSQERSRGEV